MPFDVLISLATTRSIPHLREVLRSWMSTTHHNLVALVVDQFGTGLFDVAREFNLSIYIFLPFSAMSVLTALYSPKLDETLSCEYRDLPEPINLPGCLQLHGRDLEDAVQSRTSEGHRAFVDNVKRFGSARGLIVNAFMDMEPRATKALLEDQELCKPPIYPIGSLTRDGSNDQDCGCLTWLDNQPIESVLFVSFGSGGTLSRAQLIELAFGLEMSQQRFIWVVRVPDDKSSSGAYLRDQISHEQNPFDFLPDGFLFRTKDRGLIVHSWAPQVRILSHGSTGGFLTHCGWNSTLESVVHGVPIIAWPLFAEQPLNAALLSGDDVRVALRPKRNEDVNGLMIMREEIAKVVKELMEGEEGTEIRKRVRVLKDSASKALMDDGSSVKSLSKLVLDLKNPTTN